MTQRSALRQKDLERLIKAAENTGAVIQVDLKTLVATIFPAVKGTHSTPPTTIPAHLLSSSVPVRKGREHWHD
jgi:hypothetical protein